MRSLMSYVRVFYDKMLAAVYYFGSSNGVQRIYGHNSSYMHIDMLWQSADQIDEHLFLGNAYDAADYAVLQDMNISTIVNATRECRNYFEGTEGLSYHKIDILDSPTESMRPHFDEFVRFMDAHKDENILIHCYMGSSRSATLVLLYLVLKYNMTVD